MSEATEPIDSLDIDDTRIIAPCGIRIAAGGFASETRMALLNPAPLRQTRRFRPRSSSVDSSFGSELDLSGVRVVVVEDDPDNRDLLVAIFSAAGADVSSAASARDGFELVEVTSPQLLVSDIAMPDEDGYSLIRRVRAAEFAAEAPLPAIALTAFGGEAARRAALDAGFSLHMCKPVDPFVIIAAAKRLARAFPS